MLLSSFSRNLLFTLCLFHYLLAAALILDFPGFHIQCNCMGRHLKLLDFFGIAYTYTHCSDLPLHFLHALFVLLSMTRYINCLQTMKEKKNEEKQITNIHTVG